MRPFFAALSVGLALMVMGTSASAVSFSYRFESTDAAGNLISAPSDWSDTDVRRDFFTSFPIVAEMNWFIKGSNFLLFDDDNFGPTVALALADVEGTTDPANWSRVTDWPLPPTLPLLLVGLGGVALLRRAGPGGDLDAARGA